MMSYVLTILAGIMIGITAMRLWPAAKVAAGSSAAAGEAAPDPSPDPSPDTPADTPADGPPPENADPALAPAPAARIAARPILLAALGLGVVAGAVLAWRSGQPDTPAMPLEAGPMNAPGEAKPLADVDTMIARLEQRLRDTPQDGEGFRMLGWSQMMTGHPDRAIAPYQRAIALLPQQAAAHEGYGEALTGVAGGTVTPQAHGEFERALALDPAEPRARYFLILWQAQHGKQREALDQWIALANQGPADAPWQADVRRQIGATAAKLGVDVAGQLKAPAPDMPAGPDMPAAPLPAGAPAPQGLPALDPASIAAGQAMPEAARQAMVGQMVERLANRLKSSPADPDGWIALLRSRMVLHQADQASSDLGAARRALSGADRSRVEAAARDLGVAGAR